MPSTSIFVQNYLQLSTKDFLPHKICKVAHAHELFTWLVRFGLLKLTTAKTSKQILTLNISNDTDLHKNVVRVNCKHPKDKKTSFFKEMRFIIL